LLLVGTAKRIAPIFPVRDIAASLAHYARLGFATREYEGGGYGFAYLDEVEIHLGVVNDNAAQSSAYLFVEDADALAREWQSAGVSVNPPEDMPWGQREGVCIDPDGNVIRFGSPIKHPRI
jgi:catechol 2,3-dioxygenase-like lactoylglutathione lyase family enzyme